MGFEQFIAAGVPVQVSNNLPTLINVTSRSEAKQEYCIDKVAFRALSKSAQNRN